MADLYLKFVNTPAGKTAARSVGLPTPVTLKRQRRPDQPFIEGNILIGAANGGKAVVELGAILASGAATIFHANGSARLTDSANVGNRAKPVELDQESPDRYTALVFDATGIEDTLQLRGLYDFFHPTIRKLTTNARVLIVGLDPHTCKTPAKAAAQQALEGFTRSAGKEIGQKGATANLIRIASGAEKNLESTVRFFLSPRSAYVSGQCVRIGRGNRTARPDNQATPLKQKTALVTGGSRGIGAAIARTLSRDGATVIVLDTFSTETALKQVADDITGHALTCDITAEDAPDQIVDFVKRHSGSLDIVVHNAGITRDKTLGNMPEHFWDLAIAVNLTAEELINDALLEADLFQQNGRIVCVSSISGIAGNFGQTNYATSKSGVIGYVEAMAKRLKNGMTVNAVAPGFIETRMTAAMPLTIREAGRRMNSLAQGGQPIDVAETIAWFCNPLSTAVNGNIVRVCGQSLIGR